ncbi:MAG TPA: zinc metallopeptidase [Candidatus Hydrogenedentes bacterium]|nr:zinc metallopeptidase [Candidatus Hydrogenedentota bacterium]
MLYFTPYDVLVIPALLLALWAQFKVKSAYAKYSRISTRSGLTGADVARLILRDSQIPLVMSDNRPEGSCGLEAIPGQLTDHYDPRDRTLRLSEDIYHGSSIAALGIAAHEVGHAVQHARLYLPMSLRGMMYPLSSIGSTLAFPLFFVGMIFPATQFLMQVGIWLFTFAVLFTVVTLPVEFNASRRALAALANGGYLDAEELRGAKKVLTAAAMTYVASAAMAAMQLLRMVLIARGRN